MELLNRALTSITAGSISSKGQEGSNRAQWNLDLGDVICFMTSRDTSLTNQCSIDTLVCSPVVLHSVYSDEGHSIVAKMSVKFYCESVGWNRMNNRSNDKLPTETPTS